MKSDAAGRQQLIQVMAQTYPMADMETQANLARARILFAQYRQNWYTLPFQQKHEFVYEVLLLYVGVEVAANEIGLTPI